MYIFLILKNIRKFPGGSVVRIRTFIAGALGSIPGQGAKILQAARCSQKQERKIWKGFNGVNKKIIGLTVVVRCYFNI